MSYQFSLSYYYVTKEHDEYLNKFSEASGDSRQTLIMQYVRGWLSQNRQHYEALARLDLYKRGMSVDDWVDVVVKQGFDKLPDYQQPIVDGEISLIPSAHIFLPPDMERRDINYIPLTKQNFILLRTAIYFDGGRIAQFISKVVYEHLRNKWIALYLPQIQAEVSNNWLLGE
jgi:hypothetical protein